MRRQRAATREFTDPTLRVDRLRGSTGARE